MACATRSTRRDSGIDITDANAEDVPCGLDTSAAVNFTFDRPMSIHAEAKGGQSATGDASMDQDRQRSRLRHRVPFVTIPTSYGRSLCVGHRMDDQLRILGQRFKALGMSRRNFMKIAAAAAAGTVTTAGMERYAGPGAAAAPRRALRRQDEIGPDDKFYNYFLYSGDPVSFDWNLNLYCNAEVEITAGLLTFDADLNAIPDWAETFEPNEDASVWTFKIRKDNQGWTNGTDTRPVTAQDFVYSWERQLNPANAAAYAGFLLDIKNAEKFNLGEEGVKPEGSGHQGCRRLDA